MALVGKVETRPISTTSVATYRVLVIRCLLCGDKSDLVVPRTNADAIWTNMVVPLCECYDGNHEGIMQPIRIIPNDR